MNLLDENFPEDQHSLLRKWGMACRQIGRDLVHFGAQDAEIIPALHRLRRVTFFTLDEDFRKRHLCHPAYCLVFLDVCADDAAEFARRFARHPRFDTIAKRMGVVARVHSGGIEFWRQGERQTRHAEWKV